MNRPISTLGFWRLSATRSPGAFDVRDWVSESVHIIFTAQNKDLRHHYQLQDTVRLELLLRLHSDDVKESASALENCC
jgi:hypothetical protein